MGSKNNTFTILMFPWLAEGHISPFLQLAKSLVERRPFRLYFCSTAANFASINGFIDANSLNDTVEIVELLLEASPELPPRYHSTKNVPSERRTDLLQAFQASRHNFSDIVDAVSPDVVIYDVFQPWASKIASSNGIPAVLFCTTGAFASASLHHRHTFGDYDLPFTTIRLEDYEMKILDAEINYLRHKVVDAGSGFFFGTFELSHDIVLIKTCRGIEGKYVDYLSTLCRKTLVPVGTLVNDGIRGHTGSSEIINWLSEKTRHSTVFISFGSEYFLSKAEIGEIAKALSICDNVNFIWVIRHPVGDTVAVEDFLPQEFLDWVGERGRVVTGWAPQADILAHENTGCFVSHCGWSSVTESMYFGVPIVAVPMKVDQPLNARMLAEAGGGIEVRRNGDGEYTAEAIVGALRKAMSENSLRYGVRELNKTTRDENELLLNKAAKQLWQLCLKGCKNN
ncbi:UDP-glucosyltransferase 29-like [Andrographis paniculata]|uniref:UDP-glucosyltransferase 29-like n=1 Tax=Andrographis paniculata TaxID=175694 RepID=UPI0021E8EA8C|nr:UDP-glucosyltransferase 29-like [Andrographis paniculata]